MRTIIQKYKYLRPYRQAIAYVTELEWHVLRI